MARRSRCRGRRGGAHAERQVGAAPGGDPPVARLVDDDLEQPGAERRTVPEAAERQVGFDKPLLGGVLGLPGVPQDEVGGAEGQVLEATHELPVGVLVGALRPLDQFALVEHVESVQRSAPR